jgi:hypothetical protein
VFVDGQRARRERAAATDEHHVGFVTLILQLVLLLMLVEVPLAELFRVTAVAYPAILYGSAMRTAFLATSDLSTLSPDTLNIVPGSVASFTDLASSHYAIYLLLSQKPRSTR